MKIIAIGLLIGMIVAIGLYAWEGEWDAVLLALGAAFVGKFVLGLIEFLLFPLTWTTIFFAQRGNKWISICLFALFSILMRSAYVAFCALILLALLRTPGPPVWLIVILASGAASAPFSWAARQTTDEDDPRSIEQVHALIGTSVAGTLLALGFSTAYWLAPLCVLFFISAASSVVWWTSNMLPGIQLQGLIAGRSR
jgi:hypothetical protein